MVICQGQDQISGSVFEKMAVAGTFVFHKHILFWIVKKSGLCCKELILCYTIPLIQKEKAHTNIVRKGENAVCKILVSVKALEEILSHIL